MNAGKGTDRNDFRPHYNLHRAELNNAAVVNQRAGGRARLPMQTGRRQHYWCNVCKQDCESNEALREHYRSAHPSEWARMEELAAKMNKTA